MVSTGLKGFTSLAYLFIFSENLIRSQKIFFEIFRNAQEKRNIECFHFSKVRINMRAFRKEVIGRMIARRKFYSSMRTLSLGAFLSEELTLNKTLEMLRSWVEGHHVLKFFWKKWEKIREKIVLNFSSTKTQFYKTPFETWGCRASK